MRMGKAVLAKVCGQNCLVLWISDLCSGKPWAIVLTVLVTVGVALAVLAWAAGRDLARGPRSSTQSDPDASTARRREHDRRDGP